MVKARWTDEQVSLLREFYPHFHTAKVAQAVGRPVDSCYRKAQQLGLAKTPRYLASDEACRVSASRRTPAMQATQFQKGQAAWNKGLRGVVGVQEACRATQFKKGRPASEARNYQPIGTVRLCRDGYLERKVTDDHPVPARRWVAVHRLVWEAEHGSIPRGSIVVFRPGMKTVIEADVTTDRLECITRAENARRNHPRSKSPELARLVQLKGAITRQVNRITREAQEQAS